MRYIVLKSLLNKKFNKEVSGVQLVLTNLGFVSISRLLTIIVFIIIEKSQTTEYANDLYSMKFVARADFKC